MRFLRLTTIIALTLGMLILYVTPAAAGNDIEIYLDGERVEIADRPIISDGRVLLPMRTLFEMFGFEVHWFPDDRTIESAVGFWKLRLQIDSYYFYRAFYRYSEVEWQRSTMLDHAPVIINGRAYVPLRFIAWELNYDITWDPGTRSVSISRPFVFRDGTWGIMMGQESGELSFTSLDELDWGGWRIGDLIFASTIIPDGNLVTYMLDKDGNSRRIHAARYGARSIHVEGDYAYVISNPWVWLTPSQILRVRLDNPFYRTIMGDETYSFGMYISIKEFEDSLWIWPEGSGLQIFEDGIVVIGFDASMVIEHGFFGENRHEALELLRESYGYYLIPFDGGPHRFIESMPIEIVQE